MDIEILLALQEFRNGFGGIFVVYLIIVPLVKKAVPGIVGTIAASSLQLFYISFIFPWLIKRYEK